MRFFFALVFFVFYSIQCFAQKENNNWYFGNQAGITFNNGSPVSLDSCAMGTSEGTISVSDSEGRLLFYSNGVKVWNRNHSFMFNGTGLLGHFSSTQSALAVPKPGSKGVYYIFTVDAENLQQSGLRYSILDMSLDGGLGDITNTKNILLEDPVTEKLTAVRHGNNRDFWILAHKWNSNEFVAYELTSSGLSKNPVISKVGSVHTGNSLNTMGQMKANKEGTKIALAIYDFQKIELFDFNSLNGSVSNVKTTNYQMDFPYGVEFSGDGTKLYVSQISHNQSINPLLQFDLENPAGLNAVYPLPVGPGDLFALQIGPDNKIYCNSASNYLSMVNYPDSIGQPCNFIRNGVNLNSHISGYGLPNMIITARQPEEVEVSGEAVPCSGDTLIIGQSPAAGTSYLWQDGSTNSTLKVTKPGKYSLIVKTWNSKFEVMFYAQFKDCTPVIPNIISPNQDKLNDKFVVQGVTSTDFELEIFNRWGKQIYQTESYQNDWDAKGNSAGLYYYLLRNSETGATYKGWLEVIK